MTVTLKMFLKISSFIEIILNVTESIDTLALYEEPCFLKDKILVLKMHSQV